MSPLMKIGVVGHTNAGKTSLMRTLTRQRKFGDVSARPATTRHVELAEIKVGGEDRIQLFDTPGLEDSTGLLARLDEVRQARNVDWTHAVDLLIADPALHGGFEQEAKALAQVRDVDVALYVVDARDKVLAKHRDELEVLGRCAVPILPVLNFVADETAREADWREELARKNMHAIVAFDTVAYNEAGEIALYAKIATMLDRFKPALDRLTAKLTERRQYLREASAKLIADLLIDLAAARRTYTGNDALAANHAGEDLKDAARKRERKAVKALIALHAFAEEDYALKDLPIEHGAWTEDPFDPEALARFGLSAGKAVAAGATAGLAIDLMVGGLTLGAAALTGAAVGFAIDTFGKYGGKLMDRLSGTATLQVGDATLALVASRNIALARALMSRGHGAVQPIEETAGDTSLPPELTKALRPARGQAHWSSLNGGAASGGKRQGAAESIASVITPLTQA